MLRNVKIMIGAIALVLGGAAATGESGLLPDPSFASALHARFGDSWYQVRAEQRVIIRLPSRQTPGAPRNGRTNSVKYEEKKIGKCILMDRLVASRPGPKESLELATRDGALIRAYLGDGCLAREFYAGAYVERSADGKLCIDRDILHARTGAQCEIDKFRVLVPD
jgi:hypothetical protein